MSFPNAVVLKLFKSNILKKVISSKIIFVRSDLDQEEKQNEVTWCVNLVNYLKLTLTLHIRQ